MVKVDADLIGRQSEQAALAVTRLRDAQWFPENPRRQHIRAAKHLLDGRLAAGPSPMHQRPARDPYRCDGEKPRLCTATAAAALKETFGSDGQPGSYADLDTTEAIMHVGHNISNTQTVLWMRILDRRRGPSPPKLIVIDPRKTATAREADVHLAARVGTNVAVLNGLLHGSEQALADSLRTVADHHGDEPDILQTCQLLASWSDEHVAALAPILDRYHEKREDEKIYARICFTGHVPARSR